MTNCHTLILRKLLDHGSEPPAEERDSYLYNIAPDNLPLAGEFSPRETHRFAPPPGALDRHPKLIWVKCHLAVDNFCHYGTLEKPENSIPPNGKQGYTYRRGEGLLPLVEAFARGMGTPLDQDTLHYLSHILVEIAVDYAIYADDGTVPRVLRHSQEGMSEGQWAEYHQALSALYECAPDKVARARGGASNFYGAVNDFGYLFLTGRTKIVLRKLALPFSEENTQRTEELILRAAERVSDYMDFIDASVGALSDRSTWGGEAPLESGAS
ncbi:MAG: hypothetical protein O2807_14260 [bacterium]|nr:hypothetical protein [bacterium]